MSRKRNPFLEGKAFEDYAWPTVRRNFPRWRGWVRIEQPRLPSRLQPDNVLWNEKTNEIVVVEMKDRGELGESDIRKVRAYMSETGADGAFVPIAWDTDVPRRIRQHARREGITIRRTGWRRY